MTGRRPTGVLALLVGWLLACLATLALSGCGQQGTETGDEAAASTTTTDGGGAGPDGDGTVTAVTVRQTGGLAGVEESDTLTGDAPGAGPILAMAADLPEPARSKAEPPCCDFITYRVSVQYAHGTTAHYLSWDGGPRRVLDLAVAVLSATASQ